MDQTHWPQRCCICQAYHEQMMGTWVILGSGKLVCANDKCLREAVKQQVKNLGVAYEEND